MSYPTAALHETGIASPRCVDRLPSHISKMVVSTVHGGGLPFTEDTTEPFSGISWTFFPGIKLSSGMGMVFPLLDDTFAVERLHLNPP